MKKTRLVLLKTNLALLLLAALFMGCCIGFCVNGAVIRARVRGFSTVPKDMPTQLTGKLTKELNLTDEQQAAIYEIFKRHDVKMKEARQQGRAIIDGLVDELNTAIHAELTPEQVDVHQKLLEKLQQKRAEKNALRRVVQSKP